MFERTRDRKTALLVVPSGVRHRVVVGNTHGFPAGVSCPGRTSVCAGESASLPVGVLAGLADAGSRRPWRVLLPQVGVDPLWPCYVVSDLRRGSEESAVWRNWDRAVSRFDDEDWLYGELVGTFDEFIVECAAVGVAPVYRIHWDGDFVSSALARATARAVRDRPVLSAWVYTRSFEFVAELVGVENLVVYLSVDRDNVDVAAGLLVRFPSLLVAVLGRDAAEGGLLLERLGRRAAPVCPVDAGRMPTVVGVDRRRPPGVAERGVGACIACGLCPQGRRDVRFTLEKRQWFRRRLVMRPRVEFSRQEGEQVVFFAAHHGLHLQRWRLLESAVCAASSTVVPVSAGDMSESSTAGAAVVSSGVVVEPSAVALPVFVERANMGSSGGVGPVGTVEGLCDVGGVSVRWRRHYVSLYVAGSHLLSAQPRGRRLVVTLSLPSVPAGARSIRSIGHQMPGVVEMVVDSEVTLECVVSVAVGEVLARFVSSAGVSGV